MSVYSSQLAKSVHEWSSVFFCDILRHHPWFSFLEKTDFHKSACGGVDITSARSVSCLSSPHVLSFRNAQLAFSEKRKRGGYVWHLIVVLSESAHTGCEVRIEIVCVWEWWLSWMRLCVCAKPLTPANLVHHLKAFGFCLQALTSEKLVVYVERTSTASTSGDRADLREHLHGCMWESVCLSFSKMLPSACNPISLRAVWARLLGLRREAGVGAWLAYALAIVFWKLYITGNRNPYSTLLRNQFPFPSYALCGDPCVGLI